MLPKRKIYLRVKKNLFKEKIMLGPTRERSYIYKKPKK